MYVIIHSLCPKLLYFLHWNMSLYGDLIVWAEQIVYQSRTDIGTRVDYVLFLFHLFIYYIHGTFIHSFSLSSHNDYMYFIWAPCISHFTCPKHINSKFCTAYQFSGYNALVDVHRSLEIIIIWIWYIFCSWHLGSFV